MASLRNAGIVCTALDYIFDIDEIQKLQHAAPPMAFQTVREVVEAALGRALEDVFADFASVLTLFREVRQNGPFQVSAYEFFTDRCFSLSLIHI